MGAVAAALGLGLGVDPSRGARPRRPTAEPQSPICPVLFFTELEIGSSVGEQ